MLDQTTFFLWARPVAAEAQFAGPKTAVEDSQIRATRWHSENEPSANPGVSARAFVATTTLKYVKKPHQRQGVVSPKRISPPSRFLLSALLIPLLVCVGCATKQSSAVCPAAKSMAFREDTLCVLTATGDTFCQEMQNDPQQSTIAPTSLPKHIEFDCAVSQVYLTSTDVCAQCPGSLHCRAVEGGPEQQMQGDFARVIYTGLEDCLLTHTGELRCFRRDTHFTQFAFSDTSVIDATRSATEFCVLHPDGIYCAERMKQDNGTYSQGAAYRVLSSSDITQVTGMFELWGLTTAGTSKQWVIGKHKPAMSKDYPLRQIRTDLLCPFGLSSEGALSTHVGNTWGSALGVDTTRRFQSIGSNCSQVCALSDHHEVYCWRYDEQACSIIERSEFRAWPDNKGMCKRSVSAGVSIVANKSEQT